MINAGCTNAAQSVYGITINGYSDWFLPSQNELNKLYVNRAAIGDTLSGYCCSNGIYPAGGGYRIYHVGTG